MKDQQKIWDKMAARYVASPMADVAAYERKLAMTRNHLSQTSRVLEIGCGSGGTARKHAPLVQGYRALDISGKMISLAREQGPVPANLTFETGDFDKMAIAPESLDAILALSVLHLLPDPGATLAKIYATLAPGGHFVSSSQCLAGRPVVKLIAAVGQALGVIPHLAYFTRQSLLERITAAGFDILEEDQTGKDKALFVIARKPDRKPA